MKPKQQILWVLLSIISSVCFAQVPPGPKNRKLNEISITFSNSQPAMPFGKFSTLFTGNQHPGIEFSTGFNWKTKPKHDWTQTFNLGYSYHRWVQHSLVLYTETGYRYKLPAGFSIDGKLGLGYMRSIVATETFSDGMEDGKQYSKITSGRSQTVASLSFGVSKKINPPTGCRVFLYYQQRIQTPFIHSYVPLLPYSIVKAGIGVPLNTNRKNKKS